MDTIRLLSHWVLVITPLETWSCIVAIVHLLSPVQLFGTPWTTACKSFLSLTIFLSLVKLMSIESRMSNNHLILYCPLLLLPSIFPSMRIFSNESALHIRWSKYWASASASVLPMNIQSWFPQDGLVGSPCCPRDSQVFSNTTVQKHQFFHTQPSLWSSCGIRTWLLRLHTYFKISVFVFFPLIPKIDFLNLMVVLFAFFFFFEEHPHYFP